MPRGGQAPTLRGVSPKHIYEALLTGPQSMPTFSNGNLTPDQKRDVIAYLQDTEETPGYGGFGSAALGPVSEGLFAWLIGIGVPVAFAIWIAAHTTRTSRPSPARRVWPPRRRGRARERRAPAREARGGAPQHVDSTHGGTHGELQEPLPNPGLTPHTWRRTDVDPAEEKRAQRQVSALFALSALCTVGFVVAYFALSAGDNWDTVGGLGAQNVALGLTLGGALLLIGVGVIQWARKLPADAEIVDR